MVILKLKSPFIFSLSAILAANEYKRILSNGQDAHLDCGDDYINVQIAEFTTGPIDSCDALGVMREQCQDKNKCDSMVTIPNYGDGCNMNSDSAMNVEFYCTPAPTFMEDQGARKIVCDGNHMEIHCGNKYINILEDSNYGRLEGDEVCGKSGEILTTECRWGGIVRKLMSPLMCGNHKKCEIRVNALDLLGDKEDPCPGTSKYLEVHYECVAEP